MNNNITDNTESRPKKSLMADIVDYVEIFVFSVLAVVIVFSFLIRICRVDGPSMNNTLQDGEKLIISDLFYDPKPNDIIVFHQTNAMRDRFNEPIVKRVIATGNHYVRIDFDRGLVYVSDDPVFTEKDIIDESSYIYLDNGRWRSRGIYETYVPEGKLFVMGDNRNNSADSRIVNIGLVDKRRVLGKVLFRIMPLSKIGYLG